MSDEVLECHLRDYIASVTADEVVFTWQGGEPTLRGLGFFHKAVALQRKYAKPGQRIDNDLQTNGVLLDDAWVAFLKAHRFLVGLSIDGPQDVHDAMRLAKGGTPTFDTTTAIELPRTPIANAESMQASPRIDAAASSTDLRLPTGPVPLED